MCGTVKQKKDVRFVFILICINLYFTKVYLKTYEITNFNVVSNVFFFLTAIKDMISFGYFVKIVRQPVKLNFSWSFELHYSYRKLYIRHQTAVSLHKTYVYRRGGLVVKASALWAGGRGFDPRLQQTVVFETGSTGFPLGAQNYGKSITTALPVSG